MDDLVALWLRPPNVFWTRPRWSRKPQKTIAAPRGPVLHRWCHGFLLRSYGYVCKGKNKATNAIRAVKTIAKARADRAAGRQVLVGDSVNYGLFCIQVLSQRYTKTTQCIQMVCSWTGGVLEITPSLIPGYNSWDVNRCWMGHNGTTRHITPFCEGKMKNIERFKQEIAIMKMMDWQGWTAGDTTGDRWPFRTQLGATPFGNQTWQQNIPCL